MASASCGQDASCRLAGRTGLDEALRKALLLFNGLGDQVEVPELLDRLAEAFALVDPKVAQLVELACSPAAA